MTGLNQETLNMTTTKLIDNLNTYFSAEEIKQAAYVFHYFDKVYKTKSEFGGANANVLVIVLVTNKF